MLTVLTQTPLFGVYRRLVAIIGALAGSLSARFGRNVEEPRRSKSPQPIFDLKIIDAREFALTGIAPLEINRFSRKIFYWWKFLIEGR
jgi:hypothetical protein